MAIKLTANRCLPATSWRSLVRLWLAISEPGFTSSLALSVPLAVVTTLITIALMLLTTVYVHLRLPKLRRLMEENACRTVPLLRLAVGLTELVQSQRLRVVPGR